MILNLTYLCGLGIYRESDLNAEQERELVRRAFNLFSYILRSPFYDQQSKVSLNFSRFSIFFYNLFLQFFDTFLSK